MTNPWHLTPTIVDELLERIERQADNPVMDGPPGSIRGILVPVQYLHELLVLWKYARNNGELK